jgi:hypothetical protein
MISACPTGIISPSFAIAETIPELQRLFNQHSQIWRKDRIAALYLLKTNRVQNLCELAQILGCDRAVLEQWLTLYQSRGLAALLGSQ